MQYPLWFGGAVAIIIFPAANLFSQGCCSGGSGSPIAGGASQGVLLERQMEIGASYQYFRSNKFMIEDRDTTPFLDHLNTQYLYSKIGYGVTQNLTVSLETGYFLKKSQIKIKDTIDVPDDTIHSSGIADLIFFPRYTVFNRTDEKKRVELTLGLGYKMPLGKYKDSMVVYHNPVSGQDIYTIKPILMQLTNGSHDFIFYSFFFRGFPEHNFRLFANGIYIKRGWSPLGFKTGDYSSIGLFAGKTFFKKMGVTLQLKGERMDSIRYNKEMDKLCGCQSMVVLYNIDTKSTGYKKLSLVPQLNYSFKNLTVFGLFEFPLYEYVNGIQVASQTLFTTGLTYRFFTVTSKIPESGKDRYACSMNCEGGESNKPGNCRVCGMKLEKK